MKPELLISVVICTRNRAEPLRVELAHYQSIITSGLFKFSTTAPQTTRLKSSRHFNRGGLPVLANICARPGLCRAREYGKQVASGIFLIFTDDDCYPAPSFIHLYCQLLAENTNVDFFGGRILLWDENDTRITVDYRTEPDAYPTHMLAQPGQLQGGNIAIRRDVLDAIGGFDVNMGAGTPYPCEDIDLIARALMHGSSGPDPVIFHQHRRKEEQVPAAVRLSYAKGRSAYIMKYFYAPQTRGVAASNCYWYWKLRSVARDALRLRRPALLREPWVEVNSAHSYLLSGNYAHRPRSAPAPKPTNLQTPP